MSDKSIFEQMKVQYEERNGFFYPVISFEDFKAATLDIGKYGHLWVEYMQEIHPARYRNLVRFGKIQERAILVNEIAYELLEDTEQAWLRNHKPKEKNSFMEQYKLRGQARMLAEEIVLHDLVYRYH